MPHPKKLLAAHGLTPKKSLGQNFLFDERLLQRLVSAAEVTADDEVLEIGPGLGALTQQLAKAARRVVAVELDGRLWPILRQQLASHDHVQLVQGDILEQDPSRWFATRYKVVANVPYYITGAILRHLLTSQPQPILMVLTIQKEVAERLLVAEGKMNLLALSVQFYGRPRLVAQLPAGAFWPRPQVDSSVVAIDLRQRPAVTARVDDEAHFFRLVRAGFGQKRKQLHKNLQPLAPSREVLQALLAQAEIDGRRRAETLSLAEWVALYQALTQWHTPG